MSSNSGADNNFMSTFSSIAYEQLTGHKPSATALASSTQKSSSANISLRSTTTPASTSSGMNQPSSGGGGSNNNGTSHWAVGMANAGDVLGNLGMGAVTDLGASDSGTWDIPPHSTYGPPLQRELSSNKELLSDSKSRNRSKKTSSGSNTLTSSYSGSRHGTERKLINNTSTLPTNSGSSNNFSRARGLDQLEVLSDSCGSEDGSPDTDTTPTITASHGPDLDVGSMVEIVIRGVPRFGVIRWVGSIPRDRREGRTVAGVELEDGTDGLSDGTFDGLRHFSCAAGKAIFVNMSMCRHDSRFVETLATGNRSSVVFGSEDCGPIVGRVAPPGMGAVGGMMGRNKGIQGHQNSCYLDATLFSMFAFTSVFDSLLFRPSSSTDIDEYGEVQEVLREEIVNPLRARMFVRADRIMKLRTLLDNLSSVRGLTTEEKDPEEFLHSLLAQILKAEPYLQLSSGQEAYHYQLFLDKDDKVALPSVQHLFDQSFLTSDIKLKQVPSILILQMPRFGKDYKMYPRILPSLLLDVTDVIEDSPRQCIICGAVAELECAQCFGQCAPGLESVAFCNKCISKVHTHRKRDSHSSVRGLRVPPEYRMLADHCNSVPRVYMELFAVVCIETSHYVTFTRCGEGADAPWCFFDSMADRKGEQYGYNIPSVVECGELLDWLAEQGSSQSLGAVLDDKALPDLTRRLLCDAYMCFYQSSKVAMYR